MNWLLWLGGGSIAVVAVVAALYFMGLGGVVTIVRSVLGALGDAAASLRKWLARPGNKTRGSCVLFAVLFAVAGLQSWQRGNTIIQQRADYVALQEQTEREKSSLREQLLARDATIRKFTDLAERQKLLLAQAARDSEAAMAAARIAQREAAESEQKYQDAFMKRPPECKAALEVMAAACPSLKDY